MLCPNCSVPLSLRAFISVEANFVWCHRCGTVMFRSTIPKLHKYDLRLRWRDAVKVEED